jgi:hypothetical protein
MARARGENKDRSLVHEEWIARRYGGHRTSNSGASDLDPGDVRCPNDLFECKTTGFPGHPSTAPLLHVFTKVADEAYAAGLEPAVALQYFDPDNFLANDEGWVNLVVRTVEYDLAHG